MSLLSVHGVEYFTQCHVVLDKDRPHLVLNVTDGVTMWSGVVDKRNKPRAASAYTDYHFIETVAKALRQQDSTYHYEVRRVDVCVANALTAALPPHRTPVLPTNKSLL